MYAIRSYYDAGLPDEVLGPLGDAAWRAAEPPGGLVIGSDGEDPHGRDAKMKKIALPRRWRSGSGGIAYFSGMFGSIGRKLAAVATAACLQVSCSGQPATHPQTGEAMSP